MKTATTKAAGERSPTTTRTTTGAVSRVIFSSKETGYAVLDLAAEDRFDADVTVVGILPPVKPGERLHLEGTWTTHPRYGEEFKAARCEQLLPATITGIREYLASSLISSALPSHGPRASSCRWGRGGRRGSRVSSPTPISCSTIRTGSVSNRSSGSRAGTWRTSGSRVRR